MRQVYESGDLLLLALEDVLREAFLVKGVGVDLKQRLEESVKA